MEQLAQVYELASIDQLRRESTQRLGDTLRSREASPEEHAVRQHRRDRVSRAVDDLPERDRLIVQMYYYKGLNLKEIALVLDVSESRVSQLLSRIRTRLGQVLADAV